jgi:hypothetical protein
MGSKFAESRKAKPDANTRTLRPDKCLVVKSLDSSLRPVPLRNMESTAITTRRMKSSKEDAFRCQFWLSTTAQSEETAQCFCSLPAAARRAHQ